MFPFVVSLLVFYNSWYKVKGYGKHRRFGLLLRHYLVRHDHALDFAFLLSDGLHLGHFPVILLSAPMVLHQFLEMFVETFESQATRLSHSVVRLIDYS